MCEGVIYTKGFIVAKEDGGFTNHIVFSIRNLADIDVLLADYGLGINDVNTIDLR